MHRTLILTAAATCLAVQAQAAPVALATEMPGMVSFAGPPPGFDAVHASDAALADYGFPARPGVLGNGGARRGWEQLVSHARTRVAPKFRVAPWRAGPARQRHATQNGTAHSTNWSGIVVTNIATSLGLGSFTLAVAEFNVPIAQQAFGVCSGGWDYSAVWVGIDGVNNNAVLQAGTEADAYCSGTYKQASYYAWVEWYPGNSLEVTNLPVTAGDVVVIWLTATGTTTGQAFIENETTGQYTTMGITAPAGTVLQGSSVEWIMERPANLDNSLTTLTNYVYSYMSNMYAAQLFSQPFPAMSPPAFTYVSNTTMTDTANNTLSQANVLGPTALQFQDGGSAK